MGNCVPVRYRDTVHVIESHDHSNLFLNNYFINWNREVIQNTGSNIDNYTGLDSIVGCRLWILFRTHCYLGLLYCKIVIKIRSGIHLSSQNPLEMVWVCGCGGHAWCNNTMTHCVMLITPQADVDSHPHWPSPSLLTFTLALTAWLLRDIGYSHRLSVSACVCVCVCVCACVRMCVCVRARADKIM